jgi:hypothetical protein
MIHGTRGGVEANKAGYWCGDGIVQHWEVKVIERVFV